MASFPSILVIGASGTVGTALMEQLLLLSSSFRSINILVSSKAKAQALKDLRKQGIEIRVGSYFDTMSFVDIDIVVSTVGNALMRLQPAIIEVIIEAGVKHFYASEYGAEIGMSELQGVRYFRDKVVTRDHLAATFKRVPHFGYTLLVNGAITEWIVTKFFGVDQAARKVDVFGSEDATFDCTSLVDVAKCIAVSATSSFPLPTGKRIIRISGDRLSHKKLIDTLELIQGVKYDRTYRSPQIALENEKAAREREDEEGELMWSASTQLASGYASINGESDASLFGFKPRTADEVIAALF